jgi:polysaccharide biosynthesis protein PslH
MKILMLTPYLPYPDSSGGQIRTQNLLKHLRRDHQITLFSLIKSDSEKKYVKYLEKDFCHKVRVFKRPPKPWMLSNILKTGFSSLPFLVVRNFSLAAKKAIQKELETEKYDLIHVETFYAMPHIPKTHIPIVLVDQTIEYQVYQHYTNNEARFFLRPLLNIDVLKLKYWERFYWRKADKVIAVSAKDKKEMLKLEPGLKVDIVPNGVNLDLFKQKTSWQETPPKILFVGNFNWLQNTEAALRLIKKVLPLVQKKIKDAHAVIVGQHHPKKLKDLKGKYVEIVDLEEDDFSGIVNAYNHASVFAAPIKGPGGTRLKTLAAMASKLPVVSSSVGVSGLNIQDGVHVMIKNSPETMAKAIISLLKNPQKAKSQAETAYHFVHKNYDYKNIAAKLSKIYNSTKKQ